MYHRILPIILLILVGISMIINRPLSIQKTATPEETVENKTTYDYYVRGFQLADFDPTGRLHFTLKGDYLQHGDGQYETFRVRAPAIHILAGRWSQWHLAAEKAVFSEKNRKWNLDGHVTLQKGEGKTFPLSIQSSRMVFSPEARLLTTQAEVLVRHPYGSTRSNGLRLNLDSSALELNSHVHSQFIP
ncbi:MAG: LPS export ABC transporter periplasmic protein LptC [Gammaproteobacteria bacterium]|nr:MAG: LPS export ABC transporter periplasmic protein LptC [Gammaproteobacteria bacterium]